MADIEQSADVLAQLLVQGLISRSHRMEATAALGLVYDDVSAALHRHQRHGYRLPTKEPSPTSAPRSTRRTGSEVEEEKARIIETLRANGGQVADPSGRTVTSRLRELAATSASMQTFTHWLKDLEDAGLVRRVVRGRRTFLVALVDVEAEAAS